MSRFKDWLGRTLFPGASDEPPAHADEPVEEFLDPYRAAGVDRAYLAGREYRRRYLEHTSDETAVATAAESAVEGRVTPGSRPLTGGEPR